MPRLTIYWQIFFAFSLIIMLTSGALGGAIGAWVEHQALAQTEERLKSEALVLQEIVRGHDANKMQAEIDKLRDKLEVRITLIASDGTVVAESTLEHGELDNHGQRPEVEAARKSSIGTGTATRFSTTVRKNLMYVAVRASSDLPGIDIVRVDLPVTEIEDHAIRLRNLVWASSAGTALVALLLAWWLTRRLVRPLQELTASANKIAAGDYGQEVRIDRRDELGQLAATFNHMSAQLAGQFAQLDEDRQQLRAVLSSMVEGVIAIDSDQAILFANERAGHMLEFAPKTAAGRKLSEVVRQYSVHDLVRTTLGSANGDAQKLEFTDPLGKSLMLHVAQLPGVPTRGAVLVFHDTTELSRLEHLRQDFVANVSHELKTPLSVITACVETLIEGGLDDVEHRSRFMERIQEQTHRLAHVDPRPAEPGAHRIGRAKLDVRADLGRGRDARLRGASSRACPGEEANAAAGSAADGRGVARLGRRGGACGDRR